MFLSFSFLLWIQGDQAAAKAVTYAGSIDQPKVRTEISQEEQMDLLKRLRANMSEEQKRSLSGGKVFAIIGKKEPEKAEVVKEINPFASISKELKAIEKKLNNSLSVSQNYLKKIDSQLGSVQQELRELPREEEVTASLKDKARDLIEQLRIFETLTMAEDAFNIGRNTEITDDLISNLEKGLQDIRSKAEGKFPESSSFNQRMINLEKLLRRQKDLLAMAPEQRVQEKMLEMERYLSFLENDLKKDAIKPETVKNIRIRLDEMVDPKKLNFPASQQVIITERVNNLKHLLGIFDHLLHMQMVAMQRDLSAVMTEGVAVGLRNVKTELEQLFGLPEDLFNNANKYIARVNNQLVLKLFEFTDQLGRESAAIANLIQLKEKEEEFVRLKKLRNNLNLTENQERDIDERFVEIEDLYENLEQREQKERELKEQREREESEAQKKLLDEGRLYELETHAEEKRKAKEEKERQLAVLGQKQIERRLKINALHKEMQRLTPRFNQLILDWIKKQNEEVTSDEFYQRSKKLYQGLNSKKSEQKLKNLREQLEKDKDIIKLFLDDVMAIHKDILSLYSAEDFNKGDLIGLLTEWSKQLLQLNDALLKRSQELEQMNLSRTGSMLFIGRNKYVQEQMKSLIEYIRTISIANDKFIERSTQERDKPKKAPKPKRQGAFSQYF